jgi:hypothetical protein
MSIEDNTWKVIGKVTAVDIEKEKCKIEFENVKGKLVQKWFSMQTKQIIGNTKSDEQYLVSIEEVLHQDLQLYHSYGSDYLRINLSRNTVKEENDNTPKSSIGEIK